MLSDDDIDRAHQLLGSYTHPRRQPKTLREAMQGFRCYSLDEVAAELGISREGVRQIEQRALEKLRVWLDKAGLGVDDLRD
jgi:DNA-directed RNA polymerase sigma subunit (sigma70/sigma32)